MIHNIQKTDVAYVCLRCGEAASDGDGFVGQSCTPSIPQPEKECCGNCSVPGSEPNPCMDEDCACHEERGGVIIRPQKQRKEITEPASEWKESDNSNEWKNIADAVDRLIKEAEQLGYERGMDYKADDEYSIGFNRGEEKAKKEEQNRIIEIIENLGSYATTQDFHDGFFAAKERIKEEIKVIKD